MFDNTEMAFSHFDDKELKKAWWLFKIINNNFLVNIGPPLTLLALKLGLPVVPLIRSTIFEHFCGGETIEDCEDNIAHLWEYGVGTILDYSVEGEKTEADRSEERRVGKEGCRTCRSRWSPDHEKKKKESNKTCKY